MIKKIISGGQTGADRAALDAAIKMGVNHGGWIPKGRKTEEPLRRFVSLWGWKDPDLRRVFVLHFVAETLVVWVWQRWAVPPIAQRDLFL